MPIIVVNMCALWTGLIQFGIHAIVRFRTHEAVGFSTMLLGQVRLLYVTLCLFLHSFHMTS